ncbi:translation initiation factor IF-2, partial [Candidatus Sumerlaeota bacterium]|nr:translation initiation factor IF-2 [Candidatus Sumerlaeota bacterium]
GGEGKSGKTAPQITGPVRMGSTITVGEFAERTKIPAAEIIKKVFLMGKMLTINHLIEADLCELIAQEYGVELEIQTEGDEQDIEAYRPAEEESAMVPRSPVVTIMGHVDHGKTTLLDAFRSSKVALGEFGGITQHIGAYRVSTARGMVTFLDTPGHEAFTSMRARGAQVTDIVVLVVSADDGVMPQTVEAINHAREAGVPIIVAINKIDLPQANPQKVRTELMQYNILPEALGGSNIFVEISAKKKTNLDELLEMILLQAEILELKADPSCRAEGTIIESHVDPLRGAVATVLVIKGTLHIGDIFVVGTQTGRVRGMIDDTGTQVREAGPAHPVEVIGLSGTPEVGEPFIVMNEERIAREIASRRVDRRRMRDLGTTRHVTLEGLHDLVEEGKLKDLKIVLKADVQGSLEAVTQSLVKLSNDEVKLRILHKGVGGVSESDVNLAAASDAVIIGFNVRPDPAAAALAQHEAIEIKTYRVIYELIEEVQKAILGMLEKRYKEVIVGRAEIRQIFRASRRGNIAGCMVTSGEINRSAKARIVRDNIVVYDGKIGSLRRVKDDVSKVASGYECGLTLENFGDIKEGDIIEVYAMEEIPSELAAATT